MVDIAQLGIQVESRPAVKAVDDLKDLTAAAGQAEGAVQDLAAASSRGLAPAVGQVGKGAVLASQNTRMFAMQLSQVAQQTSATGNFVQALAIQLPDMALGFGAVGIAAGVLASVALPALASMFGSASGEGEILQERLDALSSAVDSYVSAVEAANVTQEELIEKYGRLAGAASAALDAMAAVERIDALNAVDDAISGVVQSLTEMREFSSADMLGVSESAMTLRDTFGMAYEDAARLRGALEDLSRADGLAAQATAAQRVREALLGAYGSADAMPRPLRDAYAQMAQISERAARVAGSAKDGAGWVSSMASAASGLASYFASADGAAAGLASTLSNAAKAAWSLAQGRAAAMQSVDTFKGGGLAAQYAQYGAGRVAGENAAREKSPLYGVPSSGGGSGGGGGGGGGGGDDGFASRLKSLTDELSTERETLDAWYEEQQATLADRRAQEILGEQGHREALLGVEAEYQSRLKEIQSEAQTSRLSQMGDFWGAMAGLAESGGKRSAKAVATFQAIEGTVNAYGAAIKALNTPGLTIWGRMAAYASVLGAGLKGVAGIRSAGGIGGGGASVAAQGATGGGTGPQAEISIRGLGRDRSYSGAELEQIFDGIHGVAKTRGMAMPMVAFV